MRSVALVGSALSSRDMVKDSKADEIWSLSWSYRYDHLPRMDRMFELHDLAWFYEEGPLEGMGQHWEWLKEEHDFPIYLQEKDPDIPSGVKYPRNEVDHDIFGDRLVRGYNTDVFYTCTLSFMLALAIHEEFEVAELYGFDMLSDTEYAYQNPGANFMIGLAIGRGMTVVLPDTCPLAKAAVYAYERAPMILLQDLELGKQTFEHQQKAAIGLFNKARGRYETMNRLAKNGKIGVSPAGLQKAFEGLLEANYNAGLADGALQATQIMIDKVNLKEPDMILENRLVAVE